MSQNEEKETDQTKKTNITLEQMKAFFRISNNIPQESWFEVIKKRVVRTERNRKK